NELRRDPTARRDIGGSSWRGMGRYVSLVRKLPGDGEEIIAQEYSYDANAKIIAGGLYRVDTRNRQSTAIGVGKPDAGEWENWIVDNHGVARGYSTSRKGARVVYARSNESAGWQQIAEHPESSPGPELLAVDEETGGLYV